MKFIRSLTEFKYPISSTIPFTLVTDWTVLIKRAGILILYKIFSYLFFYSLKKNCLVQKTNTELKILFSNIVNTDDLQMISAC